MPRGARFSTSPLVEAGKIALVISAALVSAFGFRFGFGVDFRLRLLLVRLRLFERRHRLGEGEVGAGADEAGGLELVDAWKVAAVGQAEMAEEGVRRRP